MITNPDTLRVLCFGDSNTHGAPSDDPEYVRLPANRRWTGLLQELLGDRYDVVEEGLSWRTTDLDEEESPGINGRTYFRPCLPSHDPLDVVVVMLGTNDLNVAFDRAPTVIAKALHGYIDDIADNVTDRIGRVPVIVLVSPIPIDDTAPRYPDMIAEFLNRASVERSRQLAAEIEQVARERDVLYADAAQVAHAGDDGLHLSPDSHSRLAELVASKVRPAS